MTLKQFYVVVRGRQPGIYQKWFGEDGAAEQVEGLDEAIFKGFETREEVLEWLRGFGAETLQRLAPDLLDLIEPRSSGRKTKSPENWLKAGKVVIYTDGEVIDDSGPGGYGVVLRFREHR
jgi:ribonuclease HI